MYRNLVHRCHILILILKFSELLSRIEDLEHLSMTDPSEASDQLSNIVDAIIESGRAVPLSVSMVSIHM